MRDTVFVNQDMGQPLQQHCSYRRMLNTLGAEHHDLTLPSGRAVLVQTRKFWRLGGLQMATAIDVQDADDIRALYKAAVHLINPLRAIPDLRRTGGYRQIMTPAHIAWLALQPETDMRHAMQGKWRNRLRQAESRKIRTAFRPFDAHADQWLLAAEAAQQRRQGYRGWAPALVMAFAAANPGAVWVATAGPAQSPIAALLFLLHKPRATYQIGWASDEGRRLNAKSLLLNLATTHLFENGFRRLDLGIIDTETAPGLARFKLGAGARVDALGGTWLRLPKLGR